MNNIIIASKSVIVIAFNTIVVIQIRFPELIENKNKTVVIGEHRAYVITFLNYRMYLWEY